LNSTLINGNCESPKIAEQSERDTLALLGNMAADIIYKADSVDDSNT